MGKKRNELGYIDIPTNYYSMNEQEKEVVCVDLFNKIITLVDRELPPYMSRIQFIDEVLRSTLITNEEEENYEVCSVIKDIMKIINEA